MSPHSNKHDTRFRTINLIFDTTCHSTQSTHARAWGALLAELLEDELRDSVRSALKLAMGSTSAMLNLNLKSEEGRRTAGHAPIISLSGCNVTAIRSALGRFSLHNYLVPFS